MNNTFWAEFSILFIAAILGSIAILPYGLRLAKESQKNKKKKLPLWLLLLLSIVQNAVLFAVVIGIGLVVARQFGLGAPLLDAIITGKVLSPTMLSHLYLAVILGIIGGSFLLILDLLFLPYLPKKLLDTALKTTQLENFTASFYGGINEELLTRLFGVSVIIWLLAKVWHSPTGLPITSDYWIAIVVMALIFAVGHLPALKNLVGNISSALLLRTIILNTSIGIICGWLFWHYGIETAIIAHFAADIIYHVGGTTVLHKKFRQKDN